jgi:hypothetical protein
VANPEPQFVGDFGASNARHRVLRARIAGASVESTVNIRRTGIGFSLHARAVKAPQKLSK